MVSFLLERVHVPDRALVSVVIPCYNQGAFLADAVRSVAVRSHPAEVVIVDDGSTDTTSQVAAGLAEERRGELIVRLVRQGNEGVSRARNRGLLESHGDYIVFLDADDRLTPDALEVGARALDADPKCSFVYGRCQMMSVEGALLPTPMEPRIEGRHYHELLRRNFIWTPAVVMFRRQPLERSGAFNPIVSGTADYELYLRLARTYPVCDHGQIVAHYRRHDANMKSDAGAMLRETQMVLRSQRPYIAEDPRGLAAYREGWRNWQEFFGQQLASEIRGAARAGRWLSALRKLTVLAVLHPRGLLRSSQRRVQLGVRGAAADASFR